MKAAVLPFVRFPGADPVLGPEMRSTGEVMASAADFATAFAKAERAAGRALPPGGAAFLTVRDADKVAVLPVARALAGLGFELVATAGTASARSSSRASRWSASTKGDAVVELVRARGVDLIVNTPEGRNARRDGYAIREAAVIARVPCITTLAAARAAVEAIANARAETRSRSRSARKAQRHRRPGVPRRERLLVRAVECDRPVCPFPPRRGRLEPGRPGQFFMLEAPGRVLPRPSRSAPRRGASSASSSTRSARDGGDRRARARGRDRRARPARERLPARRAPSRARRRRNRHRALPVPLRGPRATARPSSASAARTMPRLPSWSRAPRS